MEHISYFVNKNAPALSARATLYQSRWFLEGSKVIINNIKCCVNKKKPNN
jgi:hypothetical protein